MEPLTTDQGLFHFQRCRVSAGTVHQLAADPPARLKWEVRPALKTADFFEAVYGGDIPPDLLERFKDEVVFL